MNREPIIPSHGRAAETDAAMEAWLAQHRRGLVRTATSILHDRDQAEDVVQDTFLRVWAAVSRTDVRNFAAYVSRAVYWNALKHRARRRPEVSLEAVDPTSMVASGDEDEGLDPLDLERAIASLPLAQQTVIRLRFYLGLSFREIGHNLRISANTAASRTRYALRRLRQLLRPPATATDRRSPS